MDSHTSVWPLELGIWTPVDMARGPMSTVSCVGVHGFLSGLLHWDSIRTSTTHTYRAHALTQTHTHTHTHTFTHTHTHTHTLTRAPAHHQRTHP